MADQQQTQTLSLRISDALRNRLEKIREISSRRKGANVSTSEIAKLLLESVREDGVEEVELFSKPTEALLQIRQTVEAGHMLTRAEWAVVTYYVQQGAEAFPKTPISRGSLIVILKAFQSAYNLRSSEAPDPMGNYYLGNLPSECRPNSSLSMRPDKVTPEMIRQATTETLRRLENPETTWTPVYASRNLAVLFDQERLGHVGTDAVNEALMPYWPVLWRVAARGHYFAKRQPIREEPGLREHVLQPYIPSVEEGDYRLDFSRAADNELHLLLSFPGSQRTMYPLSPYPKIAEFRAMLESLRPDRTELAGRLLQSSQWDGGYFLGYLVAREDELEYWFRAQLNGITFGFTEAKWEQIRRLFRKAWDVPELKLAWDALSVEYGEL